MNIIIKSADRKDQEKRVARSFGYAENGGAGRDMLREYREQLEYIAAKDREIFRK